MNPLISLFITGTLTTLGVALFGLCIGMTLGCVLGIIGSRRMASPVLARLIQIYVFIMQGTPLYVQLLLMCYALPLMWGGTLSPLTAGIITIGLNSIAYVAQIIRGGVNGIPVGQWEAAYVLGYSRSATLWYIILPQMLRTTLPALINETISLIKETSIMGAVGIVELTKVARDTVSRTLEPQWYIVAALIYLALTGLLGLGAQALERKFDYDKGH
jgi:polar amino acid transport system permease protein